MYKMASPKSTCYEGVKIANICGSCGKKAIPLAILGAEVTVFDISEENKRYALETAQAANVSINYVVGDVMDIDLGQYGGTFDVVFMEGTWASMVELSTWSLWKVESLLISMISTHSCVLCVVFLRQEGK